MRSRNSSLALVAFVVAALLPGCSPRGGTSALDARQAIDSDVFRTLPLPGAGPWTDPLPADAPKRIVCVIPSVTELLFTLGLGDRVVGRDDWSDWPPEAATRPALGNQQTLSIERIADLKPDLVVMWSHLPDKVKQLRDVFRLTVVTPGTETRTEIMNGIAQVAEACRASERGKVLRLSIEYGLDQLRERCRGQHRPRGLVVLDRSQSFYVPGRASFLQEIFDICNVENVAAGLDAGNWPAVSLEQVLEWNPDVILDLSLPTSASSAQVAEARGFWARHSSLAAVSGGKVVVLNAGVLVRPGPRLVAAAEELARIVDGFR